MPEPVTEHSALAAEYVLRLLVGEDLLEARRLLATEPAFSAEVALWEERFAPLFDEIEDVRASPEVWQRIQERIDARSTENVVALRRQLFRWRAGAAVAASAAAVLLLFQLQPQRARDVPVRPDVARPAPLLLASLAGEEAPEALTVAYRPVTRELVITPARIEAPADRARELWLIPQGARPISLGVVGATGTQSHILPASLATRFAAGATIAVSDEPAGGSPTGQPTGSVLAAGSLSAV
jgi:anti-sigma-K factor RskA